MERLRRHSSDKERRRYLLFASGIYLGLRISDLIRLKVYQVYEQSELRIREQKTGKENVIPISGELQRIYRRELAGCEANEYVLHSSRRDKDGMFKAIGRRTAYSDINEICREAGIHDCVGCHTLRKTFGWFLYESTKDFALVMDWLNHSDLKVTKRYIGLDLDKRKHAAEKLKY